MLLAITFFLMSVDVHVDGEHGVLWQWFAMKGNGRGDDTNMVEKITPRIKMFQTISLKLLSQELYLQHALSR